MNYVNSKIALLITCKSLVEDSFNRAYIISHEKHNENIKANRYIVSCLIDATCSLAQQELPSRRHFENTE
jgi:hypothetical protein